jgi:hypothetical protein
MSTAKRIGPIASPGPLICFINHVPCFPHHIVFNIIPYHVWIVGFRFDWYSDSYTAMYTVYASVEDDTLFKIQGLLLIILESSEMSNMLLNGVVSSKAITSKP